MTDPTPPTNPEAQETDERRLAETPIGKALFAYVAALESAWSHDANLSEIPSRAALDHGRELFVKADQFRAALVHTMLAAITPRTTPPEEPNIARMLDVSTAHLPAADRSDLVVGDVPGQTVATVYGGIVSTATWSLPDNDGQPPEGASKALNAIMQHALTRKCQYVQFDADAPGLDGFPTFDEDS